jgi:hypothetical protein
MYYEAAEKAGHKKSELKVGLHSLGLCSNSKEEAIEKYYPGYRIWFNQIGKERGWHQLPWRDLNNKLVSWELML